MALLGKRDVLAAARLAGRATGRTMMYLTRARQDLHTVLQQVQNPDMQASHSELQRNLGEFRAMQLELLRMKSLSPRSLQAEALLLQAQARQSAGGAEVAPAAAPLAPLHGTTTSVSATTTTASSFHGHVATPSFGAASTPTWTASATSGGGTPTHVHVPLGLAGATSGAVSGKGVPVPIRPPSGADAVNEAVLNHRLYVALGKSGGRS